MVFEMLMRGSSLVLLTLLFLMKLILKEEDKEFMISWLWSEGTLWERKRRRRRKAESDNKVVEQLGAEAMASAGSSS